MNCVTAENLQTRGSRLALDKGVHVFAFKKVQIKYEEVHFFLSES